MNNNMSNEEMLRRMFEEIKKLSSIRLSDDIPGMDNDTSSGRTAEDICDAVEKIGMEKMRNPAKFVKGLSDPAEYADKRKAPAKDEIIDILFREYCSGSENAELEEACVLLGKNCTDDEKKRICSLIKKASEAEAHAAFLAGFEAAKELFR